MAIITELNLLLDGIWEGSYFNDQVPQNISFEITKDKSGLIKSRINSLIHEINIVENKVTINSTKFSGTFHCDLIEDNSTIEGFWLQKGYHFNLGFARPVILHRIENLNNIIWSNSINILPEDISLSIEFIKDGELIIPKIKNRELNITVFLRVVSVDLLDSDNLSFLTKDGKEVIQ
ncbi:MAG: hypothetical protein ACC656_14295, partial [Candidatus Heimdallarchaeota archaeon]